VVLVAVKEHRVTISTGYGLEGAIPDITAKAIIDNEIAPDFRGGGTKFTIVGLTMRLTR